MINLLLLLSLLIVLVGHRAHEEKVSADSLRLPSSNYYPPKPAHMRLTDRRSFRSARTALDDL